ncbi:MAG: hypothetical protein ACOYJ6_15495 [Caulobacterales bacterium]|jgi:hypothetical protein
MFAPPAFTQIDLLLTLLRRLIAGVFWPAGRASPAPLRRCLARTEAALAQAIRTALAASDEATPELDDEALVAWFARTHGAGGAHRAHNTSTSSALRLPQIKHIDLQASHGSEPISPEQRRPRRRARFVMWAQARAPPIQARSLIASAPARAA